MAKIHVASSWKNPYQPEVVKRLCEQGHQVFDFRNPPDGKGGFFWRDVDPNWEQWTTRDYISHLNDEWPRYGFQRDFEAMKEADACVLPKRQGQPPCNKRFDGIKLLSFISLFIFVYLNLNYFDATNF